MVLGRGVGGGEKENNGRSCKIFWEARLKWWFIYSLAYSSSNLLRIQSFTSYFTLFLTIFINLLCPTFIDSNVLIFWLKTLYPTLPSPSFLYKPFFCFFHQLLLKTFLVCYRGDLTAGGSNRWIVSLVSPERERWDLSRTSRFICFPLLQISGRIDLRCRRRVYIFLMAQPHLQITLFVRNTN